MAEIKPFKALRYNEKLSKNIGELVSPLFDVVSEKQLKQLYNNPLNSIHLSVPTKEQNTDDTARILQKWKKEEVILQDPSPAIYVYYQYFNLPNSSETLCRKGFVCMMKAYDYDEKVLLRHENTIPHSVSGRVELLEKTKLNVSPTHGLYSDVTFELEYYMDEAMLNPVYETEDYQGVKDVLAIIKDPEIIEKFINNLKGKKIILADGHHRYESSIIYRKKCLERFNESTGAEGFNYHMIYLTNMEAQDLRILPTHRLLHGLDPQLVDPDRFIKQAEQFFYIKEVSDPDELDHLIVGKKWAFGVAFKDAGFKLVLKPEVHAKLDWAFPGLIKELDLTVMHYFIIQELLGIPGKDQRASGNISFERNFTHCITKILKEEAQIALITNEVSMDQVKKVCYSGFTLPQKSTNFFPKTICGFLFGSIENI